MLPCFPVYVAISVTKFSKLSEEPVLMSLDGFTVIKLSEY